MDMVLEALGWLPVGRAIHDIRDACRLASLYCFMSAKLGQEDRHAESLVYASRAFYLWGFWRANPRGLSQKLSSLGGPGQGWEGQAQGQMEWPAAASEAEDGKGRKKKEDEADRAGDSPGPQARLTLVRPRARPSAEEPKPEPVPLTSSERACLENLSDLAFNALAIFLNKIAGPEMVDLSLQALGLMSALERGPDFRILIMGQASNMVYFLVQAGRLGEAEEYCQGILRDYPDGGRFAYHKAQAVTNLLMGYARLGRADRAVELYFHLGRYGQETPDLVFNKARAAQELVRCLAAIPGRQGQALDIYALLVSLGEERHLLEQRLAALDFLRQRLFQFSDREGLERLLGLMAQQPQQLQQPMAPVSPPFYPEAGDIQRGQPIRLLPGQTPHWSLLAKALRMSPIHPSFMDSSQPERPSPKIPPPRMAAMIGLNQEHFVAQKARVLKCLILLCCREGEATRAMQHFRAFTAFLPEVRSYRAVTDYGASLSILVNFFIRLGDLEKAQEYLDILHSYRAVLGKAPFLPAATAAMEKAKL
jgi:hypothetical protein